MLKPYFHKGLKYYQFATLKGLPLKQAVFTRLGGRSTGPYASLNLSFEVGDAPEAVRANRRLVKEALRVPVLLSAKQVHGKRAFLLREPLEEDLEVEGYDILITDQPGVGLLIKQADCQAVLLFDPERRVLTLLHAGWRGLVVGVVEEALRLLKEAFSSRPEDLWAAVYPSLGACCAEFRDYRKLFPQSFWPFQVRRNHFDLLAITRHKLLGAGLQKERLFLSRICTKCHREFYSYRREGITGRFGTIAALL